MTQTVSDKWGAMQTELARRADEIKRLRTALVNMLDDGDEIDRAQARAALNIQQRASDG